MTLFLSVLALCVLIGCASPQKEGSGTTQEKSSPDTYQIIGYVAGWKDWTLEDIDAEKMTIINYAFAKIGENGVIAAISEGDSLNMLHLNALKSKNKALKIVISVGGWGAEYFSNAALTAESRAKFSKSAVDFMKRHQLDGIDLDWEYPGQPGAGNIYRAEDKENFTLMLKDLRELLDKQSDEDERTEGNRYLLTIATGGDKEYLKHTNMGEAQQYLDFVNIMTYDLYHGNDTVTGHHTNLYPSKVINSPRNSVSEAVDGHIAAGVPADKIILGLAFYGRGWQDVEDKEQGLYQNAGEHFSLSHDAIAADYVNKNGFVRHWDEDAKAAWLWNPDSKTFITYADEESFSYKIDYVKSKGLRGVMFWEYSHDIVEGVLLNKLYTELIEAPTQ